MSEPTAGPPNDYEPVDPVDPVDPVAPTPAEPAAAPVSEMSQQQRQNMLFWGAIAAIGGVLVLLLGCGLVVAMFFVDDFVLNVGQFQDEAAPALPAPPVAPTPPEPEQLTGKVDITEDFSQPSELWDQSSALVADGAYELRLDTAHNQSYGLYLGNSEVRDFDLTAEVQQTGGDPTAEYGIRFRQSGPGTYLLFSISGSGYYRLVRVVEETYQTVVPWTFTDEIATGEEVTNTLRVRAAGETIQGFINGTQVVDVVDEVQDSGQLTLGLGTFATGGLVVRFDNLAGTVEGAALDEDFSDPENVSWSIDGGRIANGVYDVFAGGGIQTWRQPLPPQSYEVADFLLEVDATLLDGGEGAAYGLMFGDGGSFDFYALYILPNGVLTIVYSDGAGNAGPVIQPRQLDSIETGLNATNTLRVEVRDDEITITINDETLPELRSSTPIRGMTGMIVSSGVQGRAQVSFDNFRLEELVEGDAALHAGGAE